MWVVGAAVLALWAVTARAGDAPSTTSSTGTSSTTSSGVKVFEGSPSAALEDRLKKAYDEFQKKNQADQQKTAQTAAAGGGAAAAGAGQKGGQQGKQPVDAEYKEMQANNLASVKDLFQRAEAKFKEENYREAAALYSSVALANVPKSEKLVDDSRARFIEMEGLAEQHLNLAEDAMIARDFMKAVDEFAIVVKVFPYTKAFEMAERRMVSLKTRPDVAASVELAEAEAMESSGNLLQAVKQYQAIVDNQRFANALAQMKAKRKLDQLGKNEASREQLKQDLAAQAEREAPKLMASAKNFLLNNMPAKAKEKYQTVLEKWPGTKQADEAQQELAKLP